METVVVHAIAVMLGLSALLTLVRIVRGPSIVDRAVASDVLVATLVVALAVEAAVRRDPFTLPILVSLALLGFVGSVSVARFGTRGGEAGAGTQGADETLRTPDASDRPATSEATAAGETPPPVGGADPRGTT